MNLKRINRDLTACPESTVDSASQRTLFGRLATRVTPTDKSVSRNFGATVGQRSFVRESTLDSAERRDFIRNAALTTAAVGVGGALFKVNKIVPESSASTDVSKTTMNHLIVDLCANFDSCGSCNGNPNFVCSSGKIFFGSAGTGEMIGSQRNTNTTACYCDLTLYPPGCNLKGLDFYTDFKKRVSITNAGCVGIGTCVPSSTLDVNGNILGTKLTLNQTVLGATTLTIDGSISAKTVITTTNYAMGASDFAVLANGAIKVVLPPASTSVGMIIFVKNTSMSTVTIDAFKNSSETDTIEGDVSKKLKKQYDSLQLISNGTNEWFILGNSICAGFTS